MSQDPPPLLAGLFSQQSAEMDPLTPYITSEPTSAPNTVDNLSEVQYGYDQTVFGSFHQNLALQAKQYLEKSKVDPSIPSAEAGSLSSDRSERLPTRPPHLFSSCLSCCFGRLKILTSLHQLLCRLVDDFNRGQHIFVFVAIVAFLTAVSAITVDIVVFLLLKGRTLVLDNITGYWTGYLFYLSHIVLMCALALYFTHSIAPNAAGSGLPEMKCILSGIRLEKYLSFNTLCAKFLGLILGMSSGMIIGRQGPFVHFASCLVNTLSSLRIYSNLNSEQSTQMQMIAAACAMGLSVAYGTPVGGVLFSIEVTSTYYPIRYYLAAFFSSTISGFTFRVLWNAFLGQDYMLTLVPVNFNYYHNNIKLLDWLFLIILTICSSLLGVLFIKLNTFIVSFRRLYARRFPILNPYYFTMLVALLTGILFYPRLLGPFIELPSLVVLRQLLDQGLPISFNYWIGHWHKGARIINLFLFIIIRFILGALTCSAAIPVGVYAQNLALGSAMGCLFAQVLDMLLPNHEIPLELFALVGCCSFSSSITQTISTAVIMMEITGDLSSLYPSLVTVVISIAISRKLSFNIYDTILIIRRLPYLPNLHRANLGLRARDLMNVNVLCLTLATSLNQMKELLDEYILRRQNFKYITIPIIKSEKHKLFMGSTTFETLYNFYNRLQNELKVNAERISRSSTPAVPLSQQSSSLLNLFDYNPSRSSSNFHQKEQIDPNVSESPTYPFSTNEYLLKFEPNETSVMKSQQKAQSPFNLKFKLLPRLNQILYENSIQCALDTPISTIHVMFSVFHTMNVFVVENGDLMGIITREQLLSALG